MSKFETLFAELLEGNTLSEDEAKRAALFAADNALRCADDPVADCRRSLMVLGLIPDPERKGWDNPRCRKHTRGKRARTEWAEGE